MDARSPGRRPGVPGTSAGWRSRRSATPPCRSSYRHPARVGKAKLYQLQRVPPGVRDIAWKAQSRLCARYRALSARGKRLTVAVTAAARELAGFIWAIGREGGPT